MKKIVSKFLMAALFAVVGFNSVYAQSVNDTKIPIYDGVSSYVDTNFGVDTGADSFLAYDKDNGFWRMIQMNPDWYYLDGNGFQFNYSNSILTGMFSAKANTSHTHSMSDITGLSSALSDKVDYGYMNSLLTALQGQVDSKATSSIVSDLATTVSSLASTVSANTSGLSSVSGGLSSLYTQVGLISTSTIQGDWNQASTTAKDFIKNKPTISTSTPTITNSVSKSIVTLTTATGTMLSSTRTSNVMYSVNIVTTASIGGASAGEVLLETSPTNTSTSTWTVVNRVKNSQTITLAIALNSVQDITYTLMGNVQPGYYVRLRSSTISGTPTYSFVTGQETQF